MAGAYNGYADAQKTMTGVKAKVFKPDAKAHGVYRKLYALYRQLHDGFGTTTWNGDMHNVMKRLIEIRSQARN